MKHFARYFLLILMLAVCFAFSGCGRESRPKLVMVTSAAFPPYEYVSGQKIDGIDPAILRNIAEKLGYELEIHDMSFESVIAAVQSGKADIAASGITITEERKRQVHFTLPYVVAEQVVLVLQNSPIVSVKKALNLGLAWQSQRRCAIPLVTFLNL